MKKKNVMLLTSIFILFLLNLNIGNNICKAEKNTSILKIYPSDDSYISHKNIYSNYGPSENMIVRNDYGYAGSEEWGWDTLIKFDISSKLRGTQIISAKLCVYYSNNLYFNQTNRYLSLHRITNQWNENSVNWDNQPTYSSYNITTSIPEETDSYIKWDVTEDIKSFTNGIYNNYGWKITDENKWDHLDIPEFHFKTKESNKTSYYPYLEVEILNQKPNVDFTYNIYHYQRKIELYDNSSDQNGSIENYEWDFGDNTKSNIKNTTHTYTKSGNYNVTLTVEDNTGEKNSTTKKITISKEKIIKKEIEKQYNITLKKDIYLEKNYFVDLNNIIKTIHTINKSSNYIYLLSINNSINKIFFWNKSKENITKTKYILANITDKNYDKNNSTCIIKININRSDKKWNYIQINNTLENYSHLYIKNPNGKYINNNNYWYENKSINILDDKIGIYTIILTNNTLEKEKNIINQKTKNSKEITTMIIIISIFFLLGIMFFLKIFYKKRYFLNYYIIKGNFEIKEIDKFAKNIKKR